MIFRIIKTGSKKVPALHPWVVGAEATYTVWDTSEDAKGLFDEFKKCMCKCGVSDGKG